MKGEWFMARRKFDRNFKLTEVKLLFMMRCLFLKQLSNWTFIIIVYIAGFVNTNSMKKVRSLVMGAHFIIISMN